MLVPDFYDITEFKSTEDKVEAKITLNKDHLVYNGHFPEQPVVPGVMQLQIIKELVEKAKNSEFLLSDISAAKFLKMIIPAHSEYLNVEIDLVNLNEDQLKINAKIFDSDQVYTKLKALLTLK